MHRIDTQGNKKGRFYDGDPSGTDIKGATVLDASWLNAVQEEICGVISSGGMKLEKGKNDQLVAAISQIIRGRISEYDEERSKIIEGRFKSAKDRADKTDNEIKKVNDWQKGFFKHVGQNNKNFHERLAKVENALNNLRNS